MSKEPNLKVEGKPPASAKGMVSEEDLIERIKKVKDEDKKPEISMERVILFMAENTYTIKKNLEELLDLFKGAKPDYVPASKPVVPVQAVKKEVPPYVPKAPETPTETITTKPQSPRIAEIVEAFKPVDAFVTLDTESSAQFVLVRPRGYLGTGDFAKVGAIARNVGGVYVKQGKTSHFKVPKIVGKTSLPKTITEAPKVKPTGTNKDLFPENLAKLLSFEDVGTITMIRPIKFLGAENFAKVASIVRNNDGKYISAGKESHFELPKK